jgi:hypothetical protein
MEPITIAFVSVMVILSTLYVVGIAVSVILRNVNYGN